MCSIVDLVRKRATGVAQGGVTLEKGRRSSKVLGQESYETAAYALCCEKMPGRQRREEGAGSGLTSWI